MEVLDLCPEMEARSLLRWYSSSKPVRMNDAGATSVCELDEEARWTSSLARLSLMEATVDSGGNVSEIQ